MFPQCNYSIPSVLLRFLGACVYGDSQSYYLGLSEAERSELEKQGHFFGLTTWLYRYLYDILPEEKLAKYRTLYQARQIKAMMGEQELKRLYRVLTSHGLRFVPIKGADLAYRLYPDAALRPYGDWDIWFHPDDCERALTVLAEDGWTVPEHFSNDHKLTRTDARHHFFPHRRGGYMLEPHFSLSNFEGIDVHEMWEHTVEYPNGDGQRVLSPEMNLLMIARHASSRSYYHAQIPKLVTDAAVLIQKEKVNSMALRELAKSWHMPYPGDLLAAFPEFFPTETIEMFDAKEENTDVLRKIFELRGILGEQDFVSLMLGKYEIQGKVFHGIMNHIKSLRPNIIRSIYHLPKDGAWGSLTWSYVRWFWTRVRRAKEWIIGNRQLKRYSYLVESIESLPLDKESGE